MTNSFRALSRELVRTIRDKFWDKEADFLLETYPPKPGGEKYSFLWGYGALLTMLTTYLEATGDRSFEDFTDHAFERLELYKATNGKYTYYDSHPTVFGAGEPYYDDNAWIVLALIKRYKQTGKREYLGRAEEVTKYIYSGENKTLGGIYWREHNCTSMNVCSCGPTIVLSCKLYELTGKREYLDFAEKLYAWTYDTLADEDGTFFDAITESGKIVRTKYTYNTGTMLWSSVLLFDLTLKEEYFFGAMKSAVGAMQTFVTRGPGGKETLPATPWFHVYLLQGMIALDDCAYAEEFLDRLSAIALDASVDGRTSAGLYYPEWSAADYTDGVYYHQGLDNFGTAECFALLAYFEERKRPVYCFLGSPVTLGSEQSGSFVEYVERRLPFPCIKEAVSGTTLADTDENSYVRRLRRLDPALKITDLIVQLSTNDATRDIPLGEVSPTKYTPRPRLRHAAPDDLAKILKAGIAKRPHSTSNGPASGEGRLDPRLTDPANTAITPNTPASEEEPLTEKLGELFDVKTTVGAMEYIIAYATETWGCKATFYTNLPFKSERYEAMIAKLYELKAKWGIDVVDFYNFRDMPAVDPKTLASFMTDPIHPSPLGYEYMAKRLLEYFVSEDNKKLLHANSRE